MRGSYPGTATLVVPGRTAPGRLDRKMCSISVMPIPSRTSTPKCDAQRWYSLRLVTVRWAGAFLADPLDLPVVVPDFVAD